MPFSTYCESLCTRACTGRFMASRARMTASSSMRLLVVAASPPHISFSCPPLFSRTPQPPGPGLPRQAPSVKMSTAVCAGLLTMDFLWGFTHNRLQGLVAQGFLLPAGSDQAHAGHPFDGAQHIDSTGKFPPAAPGLLGELPALQ